MIDFKAILAIFTTKDGRLFKAMRLTAIDKEKLVSYAPNFETSGEALWAALNEQDIRPVCATCGGKVKFKSPSSGFFATCSLKCGAQNPATKDKTAATQAARYQSGHHTRQPEHKEKLLSKYGELPGSYGTQAFKNAMLLKHGVDNAFKLTEKLAAAHQQKYGVPNPQQRRDVREKTASTVVERFGGSSPFSDKVVAAKSKETLITKYGVENAQQSIIVKEKTKATCLSKYGGSPASNRLVQAKSKSTSMKKYGVQHPMQHPDISSKAKTSSRELFIAKKLEPLLAKLEVECNILPVGWTASDYIGGTTRYSWKHVTCGAVFQCPLEDGRLPRCVNCIDRTVSKPHAKLIGLLEKYNLKEIVINDRTFIAPLELDIWFPEKKLGVEVNGEFWHHATGPAKPLLHKTKLVSNKQGTLLHFWVHEIEEKPEIVASMIAHRVGASMSRISARKCELRTVSWKIASSFYLENHLQGAGAPGSHNAGLYYNDVLVGCCTLGKPRFKAMPNCVELYRMCFLIDCAIVGGVSKLMSWCMRKQPYDIVTYADKRYSTAVGYNNAGYQLLHTTPPGYFYYHLYTGKRVSRYQAQKHKLSKLLQDEFDPALTEGQNMENAGYVRLDDCGNDVLLLKSTVPTIKLLEF